MKSSAPDSTAAARTSSSGASGSPSRMLSRTVPRRSVGCWGTHASWRRQSANRKGRHVGTANRDPTLGGIGETEQERGEGGLPRAARTDERHGLARRELEVDAVEDAARARGIRERDVLECDRVIGRAQRGGAST